MRAPLSWGRAVGTLLVAALVALGALGGPLAGAAAAHATLLATSPAHDDVIDAAPTSVDLRFDEAVNVVDGAVRVFGPDGERVDRGRTERTEADTALRTTIDTDDGRRGTYTVAWRVLSEDGHDLAGSFVFHVGVRTGAVELASGDSAVTDSVATVLRWVAFAGAVAAIGAAALALLGTEPAVRARLRPMAAIGAGSAALAVLGLLVAQAASASGRSLPDAVSIALDLATSGHTGRTTLGRLALLATAALAAAVPALWRRSPVVAGLAAVASIPFTSAAGHAWTAGDRGLLITADTLHLAAAAVWVGGVAALVVTLPIAQRRAALLGRFSELALGATVVVAISGGVSAYAQTRSLDALTGTTYGRLVLAKVAGFAVLVGLGWINRTRLVPAVERAAEALTRALRTEVAVAVVVLALTAVLVDQPPARTTQGAPATATASSADGTLTAQAVLDPGRAGSNDVHLYFFDQTGTQIASVDAVELTAATGDIPARKLTVVPISASHVSAYGASLPAAGTWTFTATVVRVGQPTTITFEVTLR